MIITEAAEIRTPKSRASVRFIRPAGSGRAAVRFIPASMSASHHWFSAAAPPAPSAMHSTAVKPRMGLIVPGAASSPHRPVKITRLITRGLVSAKKSRHSAGSWVGTVWVMGSVAI